MTSEIKMSIQQCKTIDELMKVWRSYDVSRNFIYDGIIDESHYNSCQLKVCFLLEECYVDHKSYNANPNGKDFYKYVSVVAEDDYTFHLNKALCSCKPWNMWNVVKKITSMILDNAGVSYNDPMKHISIINIKKSEGKSESSLSEIRYIEQKYREFLAKELELANPDIIICGRVFDIVKDSTLLTFGDYKELCKYDTNSGLKGAYLYGENKLVIDMWHPSAPRLGYAKMEKAYTAKLEDVMPVIKKILRQ